MKPLSRWLKKRRLKMEWISVNKRLPNEEKEVLVFQRINSKPAIGIGKLNQYGWITESLSYTPDTIEPTHWTELPEPPK